MFVIYEEIYISASSRKTRTVHEPPFQSALVRRAFKMLLFIANTSLSPPPSRRWALQFRVSPYVRMYVVVAVKILVEKKRSVHVIDVKSSPDDDWVAANLVSRRYF